MMTYQVNILNPKAEKLLRDLAELELISISETSEVNMKFITQNTVLAEGVERTIDAKEVTQHAMNLAQESLAEDWNSQEDEHWESFL